MLNKLLSAVKVQIVTRVYRALHSVQRITQSPVKHVDCILTEHMDNVKR